MRLMPASFWFDKTHTFYIILHRSGCHCTFSRARLSEGVTSWADDAPVTLWWRLALTQRWRHQWLHFPTTLPLRRAEASVQQLLQVALALVRNLERTNPWDELFSLFDKSKGIYDHEVDLSYLRVTTLTYFFYLRALSLTRSLTVARRDHRDHRMIFPEL